MKKGNFLKAHRPEIIVVTGALISGVLSFVITLNVYPSTEKTEIETSINENSEYIGELKNDEIVVAQVLNENEIKESKTINNETNEKIEIKENAGDGDAINLVDAPKVELPVNNDVIVDTQGVIETVALKKEENKIIEKKLDFDYPVSGDIILEFAKDKLVYSETLNEWITHDGIDIKAESATPVKVSEDGTVESIKMDPRYGNTIIVKHNDEYKTVYSNLSTLELVYVGKSLKKGDIISSVGDGFGFESKEGSHLHFEILKNGEPIEM